MKRDAAFVFLIVTFPQRARLVHRHGHEQSTDYGIAKFFPVYTISCACPKDCNGLPALVFPFGTARVQFFLNQALDFNG
jgi:hypothetical protein